MHQLLVISPTWKDLELGTEETGQRLGHLQAHSRFWFDPELYRDPEHYQKLSLRTEPGVYPENHWLSPKWTQKMLG